MHIETKHHEQKLAEIRDSRTEPIDIKFLNYQLTVLYVNSISVF